MKKVLSVLLVVLFVFGTMPLASLADAGGSIGDDDIGVGEIIVNVPGFDDEVDDSSPADPHLTYAIADGNVTVTGCDSNAEGVIAIPSEIEGYPVTAIGSMAFSYRSGITGFTIPGSVRTIGDSSFMGCSGLEDITIPDGVVIIGSNAFSMCNGLISVTLPDSVTGIGANAFNTVGNIIIYCSSGSYSEAYALANNITCQTGMGKVSPRLGYYLEGGEASICGCDSRGTGELAIPSEYLGYPVTGIVGLAFNACTGLTAVYVPDSVESIGDCAFSGCTGLRTVTVPESVTSIGINAFATGAYLKIRCYTGSCAETYAINNSIPFEIIGAADPRLTYTISCGAVTITGCDPSASGAIAIPSEIGGYPVTAIGSNAFRNCSGLTAVTIPESITAIYEYAFSGCTGLTEIYFNAVSVCDLSYVSNVFDGAGTAGTGISVVFGESVKKIPGFLFGNAGSAISPKVTSATVGGSVEVISEYAFYQCATLSEINIPDSVSYIGYYAFYGCTGLANITVPAGVTYIAYYAFRNCGNVTVHADSYAERYCTDNNVTHTVVSHTYGGWITDAPANCGECGSKHRVCSVCSKTETETIPATGDHTWSQWNTVSEATFAQTGLKTRTCTVCSAFEDEVIPIRVSEVYTENYTLTITDAQTISAVRIAPGILETAGEIKNAEGVITLSASVIENNLEDGALKYDLPDGGIYSVWLRYADETTVIVPGVDATYFTQTVNADGLKVTVGNLYGVKDFYVSEGTYNTYREIKNTGNYFSVTSAKFGSAHSYSYAAQEPGDYTLVVRYTDTDRADELFRFTCEVTYPTLETDGRQIVIGNLEGVKVVRTVPGTYGTMSDIKSAEGAVGYSASSVAKNADEDGNLVLRMSASEEGTAYTVAIVYDNLYQEIHNITLVKKMPSYTVSGSSITFTGLEGLYVLRYAPGRHTTGSGIKNAPGSLFRKAAHVTDGEITLTGLSGRYSFMVQYYEESQNFYVIDFPD